MSKTWLSAIAAVVLVALSVTLFIVRRQVLGAESSGPLGWKVTLVAEGILQAKDASVSTVRALDFRWQHISDERFQSGKELREPIRKKRAGSGQRTQLWRRQSGGNAPVPFRLEYSFLCSLHRRPTPAMSRLTAKIDAAPPAGTLLESTRAIQSKDARIVKAAQAQVEEGMKPRERVQALFTYVAELAEAESSEARTALGCLRSGGGGPLGKSRLLVALCRSQGIQSRLLTGLVLAYDGRQQLHHWAEAWVDGEWLPMCPTYNYFGFSLFPDNFLVLAVGSSRAVTARGADFRYYLSAERADAEAGEADHRPSGAKAFWRKISFYSLHAPDQQPVQFLLLLPLAALIVSIARTIVGITTFGVFAPALIGLAFLDLKSLPWGLPIFALTILIGWGARHLLENFHLLQVPRVSVMLTLIVIFLLAIIVTASNLGVATTRYVALFPLVILTFLVERFWTIETEDSAATSFQTLLGTLGVAVVVSLMLSPQAVRTWMFRYPETLGLVLAALILLGRYTGYRLTELYRFEDLIKEETPPGGHHELAGTLAAVEGKGDSGDKPPQRPVHP